MLSQICGFKSLQWALVGMNFRRIQVLGDSLPQVDGNLDLLELYSHRSEVQGFGLPHFLS